MEERMSDDIDWKAKCKKVAEWMGHLRDDHSVKMSEEQLGDVYHYHEDRRMGEAWPDYTRDNAAAWRLHEAIGGRMIVTSLGTLQSGHRCWSCGTPDQVYGTAQGAQIGVSTPQKAQVLAACQLIDEGIEPREST
jgi:hypothetical protein